MHTNMRRAVHTALLTGGIVVAGAMSAHAADDTGILSGLGVEAPVDVSVNLTGLAAGVLGDATATTAAPAAPAPAAPAPAAPVGGGGSEGVASGTAVTAPVSVPVDVSTVAVGVLGDASATSSAPAAAPAAQPAPAAAIEQGEADGIATGTAVAAPVHVPVDVDGVALGVLGDASTTSTGGTAPTGSGAPTATVGRDDSEGIGSGTAVAAPVHVPIDLDGIALGILGDARTSSTGGGTAAGSGTPTATTAGGDSEGIGSGTSVAAPITIPITIGDVALGLLGDASTESTGTTGTGPTGTAPTTTVDGGDSEGLLSGIGAASPISVPITVGDVALGLLGDASTESTGTTGTGSTGTAPTTTVDGGDSEGLLSGIGVAAPISVPITVGDIALGVIGDATTGSTGTTGTGSTGTGTGVDTGDSDGLLGSIGVELPISIPVTVGDIALGAIGEATVTDPGTGTTGPGTLPGTGTTDPGTDEGTTADGTVDGLVGGTPAGASTNAGTTTVADAAFRSDVLAAGEVALALERVAAPTATAPAALATTGGPAALTTLAGLALMALGLLLRRVPRVVLH